MTESAKEAWGEVGERFASWGRRVADRYQEPGSAEEAEDAPHGELHRNVRELVDELSRGLSAFGKTIRDESANKELSEAVEALGDAITATVTEAGQGLRSGGSGSGNGPSED